MVSGRTVEAFECVLGPDGSDGESVWAEGDGEVVDVEVGGYLAGVAAVFCDAFGEVGVDGVEVEALVLAPFDSLVEGLVASAGPEDEFVAVLARDAEELDEGAVGLSDAWVAWGGAEGSVEVCCDDHAGAPSGVATRRVCPSCLAHCWAMVATTAWLEQLWMLSMMWLCGSSVVMRPHQWRRGVDWKMQTLSFMVGPFFGRRDAGVTGVGTDADSLA